MDDCHAVRKREFRALKLRGLPRHIQHVEKTKNKTLSRFLWTTPPLHGQSHRQVNSCLAASLHFVWMHFNVRPHRNAMLLFIVLRGRKVIYIFSGGSDTLAQAALPEISGSKNSCLELWGPVCASQDGHASRSVQSDQPIYELRGRCAHAW